MRAKTISAAFHTWPDSRWPSHPDDRGCGQVTAIDAGTGRRNTARTSYSDKQITLRSDGNVVLSAGPTRLELWRSDLVRMISYGEIDARVKPANRGSERAAR